VTITEFCQAPELLNLSLSDAQRVTLKSFYGEPLTESEAAIFEQIAARPYEQKPYSELTAICGARSGKDSRFALGIGLYEAFARDHSYLQPGEKGYVLIIAQDQRGGRVALSYIKAAIKNAPMLKAQVKDPESLDNRTLEVELTNNITIAVYPCSYRAPRGITVICGVADELAFWRDEESANPDTEIIRSMRRGMANVPNARLVKISTPYAKAGVLYDDFTRRHELEGVLVIQAPTWLMNPSISTAFLEREKQKDPDAYEREYGAVFSEDISSFIPRENVLACVIPERRELPPAAGVRYSAFVDPSGGSKDAMTLAIAHRDGKRLVLDCLRERRPPFSPESVVEEFSETLKAYRVSSVTGDRYGGEWPREQFRKRGIDYKIAERVRSDLYLAFLPQINSQCVELLDDKRLVSQLCGLERRTSRSGRDAVDHSPGSHDDLANSCAGVAVSLTQRREISWLTGLDVNTPAHEQRKAAMLNPKPGPRQVSVGNTTVWIP
jgi:hypothetical protein